MTRFLILSVVICNKFELLISQGSTRTYSMCGGKNYAVLLEICILYSAVKEFWKSVKIWESYCQKCGGFLFWNTV